MGDGKGKEYAAVVRSVGDRGVISCQATAMMEEPVAELEEPIPVGTGRVCGFSKYGVCPNPCTAEARRSTPHSARRKRPVSCS